MKNSEAILVTPKQFEIQECAVPEPKDHEILMKVEYVGIDVYKRQILSRSCYGLNPIPPSKVSVSPFIYLKSGEVN